MKSCCDEYCSTHGCNQGRDCPVRIKRIHQAKEELDRGERWFFLPAIRNLSLALAIMLAMWVGALVHDAVKAVA